jgi:HD superfamily phosphohydrolase YqeK
MIEFLLVVYLGANVLDQTQRFKDVDRCLYFAERLSNQRSVPVGDGRRLTITAVCKPIAK